jgi:hypothetical protein
MSPEDHEQLSDELEQESDKLEQRSNELGEEIGKVRSDWRQKQQDESVPGAVPGDEGGSGPPPEDEAEDDGHAATEVEQ